MLEQVNKQDSQLKNVRSGQKLWHGVHMSRMSGVRGDQLFDHPKCSYHNFYFLDIPLNTPR